jgi:hypothetical protein
MINAIITPPIRLTRPDQLPRPITRESVHQRTRELAAFAGRDSIHVSFADYEQAKQEVTGESDFERQEARLLA